MSIYIIRSALALLITGLWFLATSTASHACSCIPPLSPDEELGRAGLVFNGKVLSIEKDRRLKIPVVSSDDPTDIARQLNAWCE